MKIIFALGLSLAASVACAQAMNDKDAAINPSNAATSYVLNGNYNYLDFYFNSNPNSNFNRFYGHSNIYGVGADGYKWNDLSFGAMYIHANTNTYSSSLVNPLPLVNSALSLHNNSLYAHVFKQLKPWLGVDLAGNYGQNRTTMHSDSFLITGITIPSNAKNRGYNWFANLSLIAAKKYNNFLVSASLRALYSNINQDAYTVFAPASPTPATAVGTFSNRSVFTMESVEFAYTKKEALQPFVDLGLIQVPKFTNSRENVFNTATGPIPAFNLDNNGYNVGAGVMTRYKNYLLRLQQMYYQRGSVYHSNQSSVTLQVKMD